MNPINESVQTWRPGPEFLRSHLYWPLAVFLPILLLPEWTGLDLWLGDQWFSMEGARWSLRNHWLTSGLIHEGGRRLIFGIALVVLGLLVVSYLNAGMRTWRRPLGYLLLTMLLTTGLVAGLKRFSAVPCPWNLARYGGVLVYHHNFQQAFGLGAGGNCFPAGHASGGYALIALYFAVIGRVRRAWPFLLPGLGLGLVFGIGQQVRGAHFVSHDLWTLAICWFAALCLFLALRPYVRAVGDP